MFRRDLCARCSLQQTYGAFYIRPSAQFARHVSKLTHGAQTASAGRGPPLHNTTTFHSIAKSRFRQYAEVSNASTSDARAEEPSQHPKRVPPGTSASEASNRSTKTSRPETKRPFKRIADIMNRSESGSPAKDQGLPPEAPRSGNRLARPAEVDAPSTTDKSGSPRTSDDLRAAFDVPEEVKIRLKEASEYLEQNYDSKRTRNSILKASHEPMWQADWRASFDMLRLEYVIGRYVENAPVPDMERKDHRTRWDREMSPYDVLEPHTLTRGMFRVYVQRILSLKPPAPLQRLLYRPIAASRDHFSQVSDKITSVFRNDQFRPFLTTEAFEDALRFMFRFNELSNARQLLNNMIENKIQIRTSTFNLFFGSAAFHTDLRFFTYILKLKQSLMIPSDGHTWARYIRTLLSTRVKLNVFWEMERLGLFKDTTALRSCVPEVIEAQLRQSVKSDQPLWTVLEQLDARFGHDWVSLEAANKLCEFLGASGQIDQIPRMLTFMEARGIKPDSQTLSVVIHQAALMGDNQRILNVMKVFKSRYGLMPRAQDFDPIFKTAWDTRSFNACHIMWRLACGFGFVNQRMRQLVYLSLLRSTPQNPTSAEERWRKEAGKVIVFSRPQHPRMKAFLGYESDETYVSSDLRAEYRALATDIVRRDRLQRLKGSYHGDWLPLYEAAVRRDQAWATKDVLNSRPLRWKLRAVFRPGKQQQPQWKVRSQTKFYHLV